MSYCSFFAILFLLFVPFDDKQFVYSSAVHVHHFELQILVGEDVSRFRDTANQEHGSTEGIITLHDLTESIFGDILEEDEMEEEEIVTRQDGSMLVEASMNIDDFMEEMGILSYEDLESEDFTRRRVVSFTITKYIGASPSFGVNLTAVTGFLFTTLCTVCCFPFEVKVLFCP